MLTQDSNYFYWPKGLIAQLSPHFTTTEFSCKCSFASCVNQRISRDLIQRLEEIRLQSGVIDIHSGYRCPAKQAALKAAGYETAVGVSQHELGNAADISSGQMAELLTLCKAQFKAIGTALTFLHVDTRDDKVRYWTYKTM